jgi:pyruvate formate lyase activating enzyme
VTTLLIPGHNDGEDELRALASFLGSLSPDMPWHVSRFSPAYRLMDVPPTPVASLERALRVGREAGLRYVYAGNVPGHDSESTVCPACGAVAIERRGFGMVRNGITNGDCPGCGSKLPVLQQEVKK